MNIKELRTTLVAEPVVLTAPIVDTHTHNEFSHVDYNGQRYGVGEQFQPTLAWMGRHSKLFDARWEYHYKLSEDGTEVTTTQDDATIPFGAVIVDTRQLPAYLEPVTARAKVATLVNVDELKAALEEQDHQRMGAALKELGLPVPRSKDERIGAARVAIAAKGG